MKGTNPETTEILMMTLFQLVCLSTAPLTSP